MKKLTFCLVVLVLFFSCKEENEGRKPKKQVTVNETTNDMKEKLGKYVSFKLESDLSVLTANERKMLPLLINAAEKMNKLFWYDAYGEKEELFTKVADPDTRSFIEINYGPWDRLEGNSSFVEGIGEKPAGANFYPTDMT